MVGFNAVSGSWNTMENRFPRSCFISCSVQLARSVPFAVMPEDVIFAEAGSSFIRHLHSVLFPQPDLPTSASISPFSSESDTFCKALSSPSWVEKLTDRFLISNSLDINMYLIETVTGVLPFQPFRLISE